MRRREAPISSELYEEILSGRTTRERKLAVCSGSARLVAAERAELLTVLAEDGDELVREHAGADIITQPLTGFIEALGGDAPAAQLFRYCGNQLIDMPEVAAALAKHWRCPQQFLVAAAKRLTPLAVQELMDNLDRLSASPALVSALLHSASLTADQRDQLQELADNNTARERRFCRSFQDRDRPCAPCHSVAAAGAPARDRARATGAQGRPRDAHSPDPRPLQSGAARRAAVRADYRQRGRSLLLDDQLDRDVLRMIGMNRNFRRNYTVVRNLVTNSKTPLDISLHLMPSLIAQDLKALTLSRNIPDTLRSSALRLHRQRHEKRRLTRRRPSSRARNILKIYGNNHLRLDGFAVQQRRAVAP